MRRLNRYMFFRSFLAVTALLLIWPAPASATGPRVTTALFSPDKNEIHTVDFPPYISSEVIDGGVISEIINSVLSAAEIDAVITRHPVQRMVRYYLLQEHAIAAVGRRMIFTAEEKKDLIFIPVTALEEKYYYYKPTHPKGLNWGKGISGFNGLIYGSQHGENVDEYKKAGIQVKYGRSMALLKKLKRGSVDFVALPSLTVEWLINRYMGEEKENFVAMDKDAGTEMLYIIFNRKHAEGTEAAGKFKKALSEMIADGRYQQIIEKHLGSGDAGKIYLRRLETFQ